MRPHFTLSLFWLAVAASCQADSPAADQTKPPAKLDRYIEIGDWLREGDELKRALDVLRDRFKCDVILDEVAFEKAGIKAVGQKQIYLTKLPPVTVAFVAEMIARQVDGTIRVDGDRLTLVPGKSRDLRSLIGPPNPKLVEHLAQPVTLDTPIDGSSLQDILDFLSDKYSISIVLDEWAFDRVGIKNAGDSPCKVGKGTIPLQKFLDALAATVGGEVVVRSGPILILPAESKTARTPQDAKPPRVRVTGRLTPLTAQPETVESEPRQIQKSLLQIWGSLGALLVISVAVRMMIRRRSATSGPTTPAT